MDCVTSNRILRYWMNHISNFSKNKSEPGQSETTPCWPDKRSMQTFCHLQLKKQKKRVQRSSHQRKTEKKRNSQHNYLLYVPNYNMPMLTLPFHILPGQKIGKVEYVLLRLCVALANITISFQFIARIGCRFSAVDFQQPSAQWFHIEFTKTRLKYKQNYTKSMMSFRLFKIYSISHSRFVHRKL